MKLINLFILISSALFFSQFSNAAIESVNQQSLEQMMVHFEETEVAKTEACEGEDCPKEETTTVE